MYIHENLNKGDLMEVNKRWEVVEFNPDKIYQAFCELRKLSMFWQMIYDKI